MFSARPKQENRKSTALHAQHVPSGSVIRRVTSRLVMDDLRNDRTLDVQSRLLAVSHSFAPPVAILSTVPCCPITAQLGRVGRGCRLRTAFVDAEEVHAQAQSYGSFKLPSPAMTQPDSLAAHGTTLMSSIEPSPPRAVGRGDFGATSSLLELGSPSDFKEKCQEVQDRINRLLF